MTFVQQLVRHMFGGKIQSLISFEMEKHFAHINEVFNEIRDIFKCQICSEVKNEHNVVFYWNCQHFFCLDCIDLDTPCKMCTSNELKPVKITQNENILAIFRSLAGNKWTSQLTHHSESEVNSTDENNTKGQKTRIKHSASTMKKKHQVNHIMPELDKSEKTSSKKNVRILKRNHKGETPLHLACKKNNLNLMKELIEAGADPNAKDNAGWTPLHDSVVFGRESVVTFLLENGANVNVTGDENMTALHKSVIEGHKEITRILLKHGADQNARNIYGETPMDFIKMYNLKELEEIMCNTPAKLQVHHKKTLSPHFQKHTILYGINLDDKERNLLETFTNQFDLKKVDKISPQILATHLVVSQSFDHKISWNIILGILMSCHVVTVKWIKDSIDKNSVQPINRHELADEFYAGFSKSRLNRCNQLPGLFSGCHFYFGGNFEVYKTKYFSFLKVELKVLVENNGGIILTRNPDPESLALEKTIPYHADFNSSLAKTSYYIIYCKDLWDPAPKYNMSHMKTLPIEWLLASIFKFELIDPNSDQSYMDYL